MECIREEVRKGEVRDLVIGKKVGGLEYVKMEEMGKNVVGGKFGEGGKWDGRDVVV